MHHLLRVSLVLLTLATTLLPPAAAQWLLEPAVGTDGTSTALDNPKLLQALIDEFGGPAQLEEFLETATDQEVVAKLAEYGVFAIRALPPLSTDIRACPVRFDTNLRNLAWLIGLSTHAIDSAGRPSQVLTAMPLPPLAARDTTCQGEVGNLGNTALDALNPPYDGGHMQGSNLGGWGRRANMTPMNQTLNRGNYLQFENRLRRCPLTRLGLITWNAFYLGENTLIPYAYKITGDMPPVPNVHRLGASWTWSFLNEPPLSFNGQTRDRRNIENILAQLGCGRALRAAVVDDTGSMGPEIAGAQQALVAFVNEGDETENIDWSVYTFKDNVTFRGKSSNRATVNGWINAISADGGDDCPEQSIGALWQAAQALAAGPAEDPKEILLVTDADAQPGDYQGLATFARDNQIRIHTLLTGTCGATGVSPTSASSNEGDKDPKESGVPANAPLNGQVVFSTLANQTGGVYRYAPGLNADQYAALITNDILKQGVLGKVPVANLQLTSICWLNDTTHRIRVRNTNAFPVAFDWKRVGSSQGGSSVAKYSGDTLLEIPGLNINSTTSIQVFWTDNTGAQRSTTKALNKTRC